MINHSTGRETAPYPARQQPLPQDSSHSSPGIRSEAKHLTPVLPEPRPSGTLFDLLHSPGSRKNLGELKGRAVPEVGESLGATLKEAEASFASNQAGGKENVLPQGQASTSETSRDRQALSPILGSIGNESEPRKRKRREESADKEDVGESTQCTGEYCLLVVGVL